MDTMTGATYLDLLTLRFMLGVSTTEEDRMLRDAGIIGDCDFEFGAHDDHSNCDYMLDEMNGESYYDDTDYSGWYGGEQGYRDGLRWSDFI